MIECGRLSDRMPAVALGRSAWNTEEAHHLTDCRDCREEWRLVQLSSRLGSAVGAGLDSATISQAVLERLDREQDERRLRLKAWAFAGVASAAAAAAVLLAGRAAPLPELTPAAPLVASLQIPLPELDSLLPAELNEVLRTIDQPYVGNPDTDSAAGDLDEEDLASGFDTSEG